jgi:hypothetical protein
MNRTTLARRYAPLAVVIAVQLLLVAVVPSTAARQAKSSLSAGTGGGVDNGTGFDTSATGTDAGSAAGGVNGGSSGGGSAQGASGTDASGGGAGGIPPGVAEGDTTHCVKGRQFDPAIAYWAPPCVPGLPGAPFRNNGGKTYDGVTATQVTIVDYISNYGAEVNAILSAEGLLETYDMGKVIDKTFETFINSKYSLYGRKVKIITYAGQCQSVPPDKKCLLPEMDRIVQTYHPYMVFWDTTLCSECFARLAQHQVVSVGGLGMSDDFATANAPYFYTASEGSTFNNEAFSDWWCGQMSSRNVPSRVVKYALTNNPAQNFNGKPRVLGIISTNDPDQENAAQALIKMLGKKCGETEIHTYFYDQDINTAAKQVAAGIAAMDTPNNPATTVLCICDPVAPQFLYGGEQQNNYYPENLISDVQGLGNDNAGQSMRGKVACPDTSRGCVFDGALGLVESDIDSPGPSTSGVTIFHLGGGKGDPPTTPLTTTTLARNFVMMANLIENAGPNLNPDNMAARAPAMGKVGGGTSQLPLLGFPTAHYQWATDMRLVYWDQQKTSPYNNAQGAFVTVGGTRYAPGTFPSMPSGPDIPIPSDRH